MPKSKTRKGHKSRLKKRKARKEADKNKFMKDFKAQMKANQEQAEAQSKLQREVAGRVAEESKSDEFAASASTDSLKVPDIGYNPADVLVDAVDADRLS